MSPAERLFLPALLLLGLLGYVRFFLCMLPGMAAAALLGVFAAWMRPRAGARLRAWGLTEGGVRLALLLWELPMLAGAVLLGRFLGWLLTYAPRGRLWGDILAAGCFLLGHCFPAGFHKNKEV